MENLTEGRGFTNPELVITNQNKDQFAGIVEIKGHLKISEGVSFNAPNLVKAEHVWVGENSTLNAPNLTSTRSISIVGKSNVELPNLTTADENIALFTDSQLTAPRLMSTDKINMGMGSRLNIPQLENLNYRTQDGSLFIVEPPINADDAEAGYVVNGIKNGELQTDNLTV